MIKPVLLRQRLRARVQQEMNLLVSLLYIFALIAGAMMISMWSIYQ